MLILVGAKDAWGKVANALAKDPEIIHVFCREEPDCQTIGIKEKTWLNAEFICAIFSPKPLLKHRTYLASDTVFRVSFISYILSLLDLPSGAGLFQHLLYLPLSTRKVDSVIHRTARFLCHGGKWQMSVVQNLAMSEIALKNRVQERIDRELPSAKDYEHEVLLLGRGVQLTPSTFLCRCFVGRVRLSFLCPCALSGCVACVAFFFRLDFVVRCLLGQLEGGPVFLLQFLLCLACLDVGRSQLDPPA